MTLRRQVTTAAAASAASGVLRPPGGRLASRSGAVQRQEPGSGHRVRVALPGDIAKDGSPVWYSGGKLAADLSWPKLARPRTGPGPHPATRDGGGADRDLGPRRAQSPPGRRTHPRPSGNRPGRGRRRRVGGLRHAARGSRRARQPRPAAGRRCLRPGGPRALRSHPGPDPGRGQAAPRRPADRRAGLPHNEPRWPRSCWSSGWPPSPRRSRGCGGPAARRPGRRRARAAERLHAAADTPAGPGRSEPPRVLRPAALADASFPAPPRPFPADPGAATKAQASPARSSTVPPPWQHIITSPHRSLRRR